MKKFAYIFTLAILWLGNSMVAAQDWPKEYLGLPGDNLNLYAVMDIFQNSETLEAFEKKLNDPEKIVNNLDLNRDNYVDYILVQDYAEEDLHNIVLRVALSENEYQDVAVFVVEKFPNGSVQIQLIGDEALYGQNYIVEPVYAETPNPGYQGNSTYYAESSYDGPVVTTTFYEISQWPVVVYVYSPYYRPWRSSWRWGYYPSYWNPWHPHFWHYYYGYHNQWNHHYHAHYRHWRHHRCNRYNTYYYSRVRRSSSTVVVNTNNGRYNDTYSRPETRSAGEKIASQRISERKRSATGTASVNNSRKQDSRKSENVTRINGSKSGSASANTSLMRIDNNRISNTGKSSRVNDTRKSQSTNVSNSIRTGKTISRRETNSKNVTNNSRQTHSTTSARPTTKRSTSSVGNVSRSSTSRSSGSSTGSSKSVSRSNRSSSSSSSVQKSKPSQSNRSSAKTSTSSRSSSKNSATKSTSSSNSKNNTNKRTKSR